MQITLQILLQALHQLDNGGTFERQGNDKILFRATDDDVIITVDIECKAVLNGDGVDDSLDPATIALFG